MNTPAVFMHDNLSMPVQGGGSVELQLRLEPMFERTALWAPFAFPNVVGTERDVFVSDGTADNLQST